MVTKALIEHIANALRAGKDPASIHVELARFGWPEADIQQALAEVKHPKTEEGNSPMILVERVITYPLKMWISAVVLSAAGFFTAVLITTQRYSITETTAAQPISVVRIRSESRVRTLEQQSGAGIIPEIPTSTAPYPERP